MLKIIAWLILVTSYDRLTGVAILSIRCNQMYTYYTNEVKICTCGPSITEV